jgi:SHS2 domain-containing protein
MTRKYAIIDHTADMALRVEGSSLSEMFAAAAEGLARMLSPSPDIRPARELSFEKEAESLERLLVLFLSELVYLFEMEGMLFSEFDVEVDAPEDSGRKVVRVTARGEPRDPSRHQLDSPVKAITQHMLAVDRTGEGWTATIVMDT